MKIPKGIKPEKACDRSGFRPGLMNPVLDVEHQRIEATDSFIAVRIPVEVDEGDTSGPIPLRALKVAREEKRDTICCNGGVSIDGVGTFDRPQLIDKELPTAALAKTFDAFKDAKTIRVGLNPSYLMGIAEALGCPKSPIVLEIQMTDAGTAALAAMRVTPLDGDGEAILMPVRVRS